MKSRLARTLLTTALLSLPIAGSLGLAQGTRAEPLTLPIVSSPLKLTYFTYINSNAVVSIKSYNELPAYQELARRTGITLDFQHVPPGGDVYQALTLRLASGDVPDIMEANWLGYPGGPEKALKDGLIIPLNDLIDRFAPNFKSFLDKNPDIRRQITTTDGTIYSFPHLNVDKRLRTAFGPMIRQDWLAALNLPQPRTIDGWYTVLWAFKTRDPNKNGKADEIPWSWSGQNGNVYINLIGQFGPAYGVMPDFFLGLDGKVKFGPYEPGYRDFLNTMRRWYSEGLIDPDFTNPTTQAIAAFDAKALNNLVGATVGFSGSTLRRLNDAARERIPGFSFVGTPFIQGVGNRPYNYFASANRIFNGYGVAISGKNKNVRESVKLLDYGYSREGQLLLIMGPPSEAWTMVNGQPAYTDVVLKNPKLTITQAQATLGRPFEGPFVRHPVVLGAPSPQQLTSLQNWGAGSFDMLLPPISPDADSARRMASIMSDAGTYWTEMTAKFILGREPMENFETYRATLKRQGIEEAIAIMQEALDKYNAKK